MVLAHKRMYGLVKTRKSVASIARAPNIEIVGTGPGTSAGPGTGAGIVIRNGAFGRAAAVEMLRNGAYTQKSCFLNARY